MELSVLILLTWNLLTFLMMGLDKWKAKRGAWRIPERVLLCSAFLFGAAGAMLGMYLFWHKVRKFRFSVGIPVMLGLQLVLVIYLINEGFFDKIYPNL